MVDVGAAESGEEDLGGLGHGRGESLENGEARFLDVANDLTPIGAGPLPSHQTRRLQAVDQARDSGRLLDEARSDLQGRKPGLPRATKDTEHVELSQGDAFGLEYLGHAPPKKIRCAQQADERLLPI